MPLLVPFLTQTSLSNDITPTLTSRAYSNTHIYCRLSCILGQSERGGRESKQLSRTITILFSCYFPLRRETRYFCQVEKYVIYIQFFNEPFLIEFVQLLCQKEEYPWFLFILPGNFVLLLKENLSGTHISSIDDDLASYTRHLSCLAPSLPLSFSFLLYL